MAKTFFDTIKKTLLTEEEMKTIDRDLTFRPVGTDTAQTLTVEQIERFNRDGFLLPLPFFDVQEIKTFRRYFDQIIGEALSSDADSYSIVDPHLSYGTIYDLMFDPRLVAYAEDLIGPDIVCWSTHYFCKMPHDDRQVAWHQDAYYWPFTPSQTVTVWLAVDDADCENACMQFVKGSHRIGTIPHRLSREEEKNVLRVTVDNVETLGEIADVALRAGQISMHSDMLLHGSGANTSDRRRCGLTLRYVNAHVKDLRDWSTHGVRIRGDQHAGQWGDPRRPGRD